jgi:EAL domain-containing protein (putative c-di-GMP-specific phosphodiesterase class I)
LLHFRNRQVFAELLFDLDFDPHEAIAVIEELRMQGVRVAIDDFGTGHSSLGQLRRLNPDKLKIDRSFVSNVADDPEDRVIVGAIINLANSLGMQTIAEGVETAAQLAFLRSHGCKLVQGYFYSPPLSAERFEQWIRERAPGEVPVAD